MAKCLWGIKHLCAKKRNSDLKCDNFNTRFTWTVPQVPASQRPTTPIILKE